MLRVIFLAALFSMLSAARCLADVTNSYWISLNAITPALLDHSFASIDKTQKCPTLDICRLANSPIYISTLQKGDFEYIRPLIVTDSSIEFLNTLKKLTACKNLGVLSLVSPTNGDGTEPNTETYDFFRPTYGYALYNIKTQFGNVYLVRGEGYADSGVEAGDQSSLDDYSQPVSSNSAPPEPNDPLAGLFIQINSINCQTYGRSIPFAMSIAYGKSAIRPEKSENSSWFVNPIKFDNHLFILNVHQIDLSSPSPTSHSVVLDISELQASGWSSRFTLISK